MKRALLFLFVFSMLGINLAIFGPQIVRSRTKYHKNIKRIKELEVEKNIHLIEIREYKEKLEDLNNPFYIEKIGREKLKMVKDGEKIYKLVN